MTEAQARQTFSEAQIKMELAFSEFNQAKSMLENITGKPASMNNRLIKSFSQAVNADDAGYVQAEF